MAHALAPVKQVNDLRAVLEASKPQLEVALSKDVSPDRLIRLALTAATKTPKLLECTPQSIGLALLTAGALGIEPDGRHGYLVPYKNQCQFIPGYMGLIALAYRNPRVLAFRASAVWSGDILDYRLGTNEFIDHQPWPHSKGHNALATENADDRGDLLGAYAICELRGCKPLFVVMNDLEIAKRERASESSGSEYSPWKKWRPEMYAKTAVKALSKYIPLGGEVSDAINYDNAVEAGEDSAITATFETPKPATGARAALGIEQPKDEPKGEGNGYPDWWEDFKLALDGCKSDEELTEIERFYLDEKPILPAHREEGKTLIQAWGAK